MASITRKPGSRFWIACYTDADGRQRQRSTRCTARAAAQKAAEGYEAIRTRHQSETQVRRSMSTIFEEMTGEPLCAVTLDAWFTRWLERVKPEIRPRTFEKYEDVAGIIRKLAPTVCALALDRVEAKHVFEIRAALVASRSAGTTNHYLKVFRSCLKMAWQDGLVTENVAARVPNVRREAHGANGMKRPFTIEEIRRIYAIADNEWRGMILAGLYTGGQRLGDIATMTAGQVNFDARTVSFSTDKTGRPVIVPIVSGWLVDLRVRAQGLKAGDWLFPTAHQRVVEGGGAAMRVSASFRRLLANLGLVPRGNRKREGAVAGRRRVNDLSFHSFRHTATSMLKNAGVSDSVTRDIVGHESQAVSEQYTHIDESTKRAAMEKLPTI
jgi:integrase